MSKNSGAPAIRASDLARRLDQCPPGRKGWRQFEDTWIEALTWLFVPALGSPHVQKQTISGTERRDAVFPNHNLDPNTVWGYFHRQLNAQLILFEFKNYERKKVGAPDVQQVSGYMRSSMGNLAVLCCAETPARQAFEKRKQLYFDQEKVILFLTRVQLKKMLYMKERGKDPALLILHLLEEFWLE